MGLEFGPSVMLKYVFGLPTDDYRHVHEDFTMLMCFIPCECETNLNQGRLKKKKRAVKAVNCPREPSETNENKRILGMVSHC